MSRSSATALPPRSRRTHRFIFLTLSLLAAALVTLAAVDSARLIRTPFPGFLLWDNGTLVQFHSESWTGVEAGLPLNRGLVISVNGRPFSSGHALLSEAATRPVGTIVRYEIESGGEIRSYAVPTMRLTWSEWAATFGAYIANGAFFFLIGLTALYLRPEQRAARALALVGGSVALVFVLAAHYLATCQLVSLSLAAEAASPIAIAYFALVFPVVRFSGRTRRIVISALAAGLGALVVVELAIFRSLPGVAEALALVPNGLMALFSLLMIASFGQAFFGAKEADERLKAGVVFAGGFAAFTLPAIGILSLIILDWEASFTWVTAPIAIFPFSVLYAVVRHDLLGAERFIRLTIGYTFATSTVIVGYATGVSLLSRLFSTELSGSPAAAFALLIGLGLSFEPLRRRVQTTVDQLFFRTNVNAGEVLEGSSIALASLSDAPAIASAVEDRLMDALGLEWAELRLEGTTRSDTWVTEAVSFGQERQGEICCGPKRSGAPFSSAELDLVKGMAGQAALALHNARAIRDLKETQRTLLRSERLAAIGQFAGEVAHGIRNPLAGIRAAAQIASERAGEGPLAAKLKGVISEVDRLELRVRTLLDFSKPSAPRPDDVELGELLVAVDRAVSAQAERQGISITRTAPDEPLWVVTDGIYLEEALLELVGNALAAMPEGGALALQASAGVDGRSATLRVCDSGPGVSEAVRDRVFDLFFTTRAEGTGIGLARVKRSIEELGGVVALEETGAGGSVFRIDLA